MNDEIIFIIRDSPEGGYEAGAPGYSIFTEAKSIEELRPVVRNAVACHFEETGRPKIIRLAFHREEILAA